MSEIKFKANTDMFGCMAYIKTNFSEDIHQYKVIGRIRTNCYCDVPIKYNTEPYLHKCNGCLEDVLLVIHCGIAEDRKKICRVALKDCEKITYPAMERILTRLEEESRLYSLNDRECEFAIRQDQALRIVKEEGGIE